MQDSNLGSNIISYKEGDTRWIVDTSLGEKIRKCTIQLTDGLQRLLRTKSSVIISFHLFHSQWQEQMPPKEMSSQRVMGCQWWKWQRYHYVWANIHWTCKPMDIDEKWKQKIQLTLYHLQKYGWVRLNSSIFVVWWLRHTMFCMHDVEDQQ